MIEHDTAQQNHWSECGRITSLADSSVASRPHRSVLALGHFTRMTDITPKSRLEGQRGYTIRTRSWDSIVEFYRDLISKSWPFLPMLRLVEAITTSSAAALIHGATSHSALLLRNGPQNSDQKLS